MRRLIRTDGDVNCMEARIRRTTRSLTRMHLPEGFRWFRASSPPGCSARFGMARPCARLKQRDGFTLVEMMVVIAALAVMLTLAGMTFHLLLRTERHVSQSFVTERSISQLAVLFRDDCHQSEVGPITNSNENDQQELGLQRYDGSRVRYVANSKGLVRQVMDHDQVVAREDFLLPECQVSITAGSGGDSSRLRILNIKRPGAVIVRNERSSIPLRSLPIEAYLRRQTPSGSSQDSRTQRPDSTEGSP